MTLTTGHRMAGMITLTALVVVMLGMGALYVFTKRDLEAQQIALVRTELDGFDALYDQRRIIAVRQAIEFRLTLDTDLPLIALWDRAGQPLAGNIAEWPPFGLQAPAEGQTGPITPVMFKGESYLAAARMLRGGFPMVVARSNSGVQAALSRLRIIMLLCFGGVLVVGGATGLWISRQILARVDRFNALADQVGAGDLSARITTPAPADEFGTLQTNIHGMLDKIEALHKATRTLSESVAHEMRTPLARVQARVSELDLEPTQAEPVHDEIRNTIRIFDAMLEIARAEASSGELKDLAPLDLSMLLTQVFELYQPVAEENDISLTTDITPDQHILGDRNLIAQLVSNLLENALKFTPSGQTVSMRLAVRNGRPVLTVTDNWPWHPGRV